MRLRVFFTERKHYLKTKYIARRVNTAELKTHWTFWISCQTLRLGVAEPYVVRPLGEFDRFGVDRSLAKNQSDTLATLVKSFKSANIVILVSYVWDALPALVFEYTE